tara:strand:- start:584 stop:1033 length:450 start_codon:yes stop_codon:yes gene_type:complete
MFEAFTLKSEEVEQKEDELRSEISALDEEHRKSFYKSFSNNLKDPDTYAVLNFFFITGLHHFYLGNHIQGTINLSGLLAGVILILGGIDGPWVLGLSIIMLIILVELPALFRSQIIVKNYNNLLSEQTLKTTKNALENLSLTVQDNNSV